MKEVLKPVVNKRTGKIHMGTVNTTTRKVLSTHCGKPVHEDYEERETMTKLTCAVCRTKIAGRATGYRYRRFRYR
jgi:hypothetical protein